ncbi:methionyl-tRNA formyltransferase [Leptospira santarosai]|uniref:Methionyl-tRNA formyltransferase n=1 Tax=Leptospira santarosai str. MOR084 TaxID=1049984 RepID=A0A0E2BJB5_9LEPT|nr:methionyl-tRNA formyltransferase [Leptospira santarosai]EKO35406.1 methionyl-tRNA formyltransferase [Leptospira santarosai str. MOR084]EKR92588.1 methionyl-tRNA formyltransferase [Leptospira santarosai str. CBC379]EKS09669.1 methionyl-tRNA formyltransferase [Leptospira santarosai str. JET]EMO84030.1 methionyl-tRNA formyltransferase [Leptospira santarosai str. AIM]
MKLGYFGTPEHSAKLLKALIDSDLAEVLFVVTNPDRPKGRSKTPEAGPVKKIALEHRLPVFQYESIKKEKEKALSDFGSFPADLYVVFAYGSILPKEVYDRPPLSSINLHGSLLPDLRGASPVQTALWKGYDTSGITIQYIGEKMDEGDILLTREVDISPEDNTGTLMNKITDVGIESVLRLLKTYDGKPFPAIPQDHGKATYCGKIKSEDRILHWSFGAEELHNRIRALYPDAIATTRFREKRIGILRTRLSSLPAESNPEPGKLKRLDKKGLLTQCGDGRFLEILELQPENKNRMSASDFLNGFRIQEGETFG